MHFWMVRFAIVLALALPAVPISTTTQTVTIPLVTLPPNVQPHVSWIALTPDRYRVVYLRSGSPDQLWVTDLEAPLTGRRVLLDATADGSLTGYTFTSDSQTVVMVTDTRIFRAPLAGGAKLMLYPPEAFIPRSSPSLTSDGSRIVLTALHGGGLRILSVSSGGGSILPLTTPLPSGGLISDLQISANDAFVTYLSAPSYNLPMQLYKVPLGSGTVERLSPDLVGGGQVVSHRVSVDGAFDVFLADATVDGRYDLFSVALAGGAAVLLGTEVSANVGDVPLAYQTTPDGQRVLYSNASQSQLHSVPTTGGGAASFLPGNARLQSFVSSTDSQQVIFVADLGLGDGWALYVAPIAGGALTRLSPASSAPAPACCTLAGFRPGDDEVVFVMDNTLYASSLTGAPARWLADEVSGVGPLADDGSLIYYVTADPLLGNVIARVDAAGGPPARVSGTLFQFRPFALTADSRGVVYSGQTSSYGVTLFLGFSGYSLHAPAILRQATAAP